MSGTFGASLGWQRDTLGVFNRVLWPLLLLGVRLWLARIFLEHGLASVMVGPDVAFGNDWLITIEILAAILLALGLLTRIAAIPIGIFSLFIYFAELGISGHILCALLALGLVIHGPGPLALDPVVGRGLAHAPLPFSRWPERIYRGLERYGGPPFKLILRLWMGGIFWMIGEPLLNQGDRPWIDYGSALPQWMIDPFMTDPLWMAVQLAAGVLLILGFATRLAALILVVATLTVYFGTQASPEYVLWALVLGALVLGGAGPLSLDQPIDTWLRRISPAYAGKPAFSLEGCPRVVIVGAGFGGLAVAKALARTRAQVTVIDRHNYHLFQPLLYQVATAALSPADIAMPIRNVLREQFNTRVLFGKVTGVDTKARDVLIGERRVPYDHLVLATGARHAYFGNDGWEPLAPGLKKIEDATHIRQRILLAFERAETANDPEECERLMTFVVVGAGPTGVELAGSIAELARFGLEKDFRAIDPARARVILVQSAPRILPMFPETLSAEAQKSLQEMGVEVRVDSKVTAIDDHGVAIGDERVPAGTVLWAAGVRASRAAKWLGSEADRAGRVIVKPDLSVQDHREIFAIGDTAAMTTPSGDPVPGLAPAAKQAGEHVAAIIDARIRGKRAPGPFRYKHLGSLATIGRDSAIADFGWLKLSGNVAWWLWGVVHVFFLVGGRNRLAVILNWIWSYVSYHNATRLITGPVDEPEEPEPVAAAAE